MMTTRKINLIVKEIKSILGDNATVEMHEVTKNNGLILHGVTIRFDDSPNVIPNIYIENYDKSHTSREIAKEIPICSTITSATIIPTQAIFLIDIFLTFLIICYRVYDLDSH